MNFFTLNQVINTLNSICSAHAQVNEFQFGEVYDISTTQQNYVLVWADVKPSQIIEKTLYLNLSIRVMDIQKADQANERDTLSDTLSIAQDIFASLNDSIYEDDFLCEQVVSLTPIREEMPDLVNGWEMGVVLEIASTQNRCQIP